MTRWIAILPIIALFCHHTGIVVLDIGPWGQVRFALSAFVAWVGGE